MSKSPSRNSATSISSDPGCGQLHAKSFASIGLLGWQSVPSSQMAGHGPRPPLTLARTSSRPYVNANERHCTMPDE